MPARATPTLVTVTKACVIEGTSYDRGDGIAWAVAKDFKQLGVLVANRTLLPDADVYGRETDLYGFGDPPRQHPTPTYYAPVERA